MGTVRRTGRVVLTNVPDHLTKHSFPIGMAVCLESTPPDTEALLRTYAEEGECALEV
jgi:hypothetical protein